MKNKKPFTFEVGDTVIVKWSKRQGVIIADLVAGMGYFQVKTTSPDGDPRIYNLRPDELKFVSREEE